MKEENACTSMVNTYTKYKGYSLMVSFIAFAVAIGLELFFGSETFIIIITIVVELVIVLIVSMQGKDMECSWGDESKN